LYLLFRADNSSLEPLLFTDFVAKREALLGDVALTGDKFFIANQAKGDYHKNFESTSFYKWMVVVEQSYPQYCMELQYRKEQGKLPDDEHSSHDFYDWADKRPTRELITHLDNAPYHHGVDCALSQKTKEQIRQILLAAEIYEIKVAETTYSCLTKFAHGKPTAAELDAVAYEALKVARPQAVQPAYLEMLKDKKDKWGPAGSPGWSLRFTSPYTPTECCIELKWADGKNYVGAAGQRTADRSSARVIKQLRERWYGKEDTPDPLRAIQGTTSTVSQIEHCEKVMLENIKEDIARRAKDNSLDKLVELPGSPSDTIYDVFQVDKETLKLWKSQAGMGKYRENELINGNNMIYDDDENYDGEEDYV
jgi:hypothetical protein